LALLVDGLQAEREQGITIDVAYRFSPPTETPLHRGRYAGPRAVHPQHGHRCLTADLAVILVDARKGVLVQTRRHSRIVAMMGIRMWCWR
jgi:bifunctional enzyme CysN/CysC